MPRRKLINRERKKRLHTKLSAAKEREGLYVEAALFGANLAALQVLSKQINFLERRAQEGSEDFEIGEFFVDVVVDLIIGQAAGKLLHFGLESVLRPLIRSRQAYCVIPQMPIEKKDFKVKTAPEVKLDAETLKRIRGDAHKRLKTHFAQIVSSEEFRAYKSIPEAVMGSVLEVGSDTARSVVNRGSAKSPAGNSTREGKTIVVQLVASAQDAYILQKTAVNALYAELETTLQYSDIDVETGKEWERFLDENVADGMDRRSLGKYRDRLFDYYEFAMWAHSVDEDALVREGQTGVTEQIPRTTVSGGDPPSPFSDLRRYEFKQQDSNQVTYQFPDSQPIESGRGGGYGVATMQKTVGIDQDVLNYWIKRFPFSFEDLEGPTILEEFEREGAEFKIKMDKKKKEEAIIIRAYEHVLRAFRVVGGDLKISYRALKDARALVK